jgi:DNA-binding MarR family transcriptional regulator
MEHENCGKFLEEGSVQELLMKASHIYFSKNYEKISAKGLHPGQVPMLRLLANQGGLSQREIAARLHVKPPSVAVSIKRMESAGLVVRSADTKDQRVTRISLTQKGEEILEDIKKDFGRSQDILVQGFSEAEECLLRRFLLQIIKNMEEL